VFSSFFLLNDNKMELSAFNESNRGVKKQTTEFGQYLHAKTLGFVHPVTNEYMEFDSELPDEFKQMLEELRK
jgi:23S rRNA pseudouridine1911/1915/1917 synthase